MELLVILRTIVMYGQVEKPPKKLKSIKSGTYTVTVTNANNCSQSKNITVVNSTMQPLKLLILTMSAQIALFLLLQLVRVIMNMH